MLQPGFDDEKQPGKKFFCPSSTLIEGVLAVYPQLKKITVERVPFPRPRQAVIAAAAKANQGRSRVSGKEPLAAYLAETYGIDGAH
ncbi:DUF3088 family protein [Lampropedia aestuarii]|uniref:DUF3088 family protein n=1 Tax=Lampropedia aestuarii TaxID=2562762 RepID=UPI001981347C|nr:DUF3088 family protein [Lampropedia aestuarii]